MLHESTMFQLLCYELYQLYNYKSELVRKMSDVNAF